jgi:hypothetical protein
MRETLASLKLVGQEGDMVVAAFLSRAEGFCLAVKVNSCLTYIPSPIALPIFLCHPPGV